MPDALRRRPSLALIVSSAAALAAGLPGPAATADGDTATLARPARVAVEPAPIPAGGRRVLEVTVAAYQPATGGDVQGVLDLWTRSDLPPTTIGGIAVYPNEAFRAASPEAARRYVFGLEGVPGPDDPAGWMLEMRLVPLTSGTSPRGGSMTLGRVRIVPAP